MGHLVGTCTGVGVADGLSLTSLAVTEVPLVVSDGVAWGCAGGAGELCGVTLADGGIGEVGGRRA